MSAPDDRIERVAAFLEDRGLAEDRRGYGHATGRDVAEALDEAGWLSVGPSLREQAVIDAARWFVNGGGGYMWTKAVNALSTAVAALDAEATP